MPDEPARDLTARDRWLLTAATAYRAGRISADEYRRTLTELRRHAERTPVLDGHAPMRSDCEPQPPE